MPENAHSQNDRPLVAPSLLELSAEIVANNASSLLVFGKRQQQVGMPAIISSSSSSSPSFPLPTSSRSPAAESAGGNKFSRVAGLRDQAAEQALIQHQTATKKSSTSTS